MLENLLVWLIRKRLLVCGIFVLVIIGGLNAFRHLPIDAFPDLTNNQVQILTDTRGMSPLESEQLVTIPIEGILHGLPHVQQVRSISKFGLSVITVVFDDSVDIYFARQLVNERLQSVRERLPLGMHPELGPITTGMGEIYQYVVEGYGYSPMELKTLHDWDIKYQLRTVPGVNEVNTWGGLTQEYQVLIHPERLTAYGLGLADVFQALEANNANFSGGLIEHGAEQYVVRGIGRANTLTDIENILVQARGSAPVTLRQLATVQKGPALRQGAVTRDGKGEVVTGIVMMLKGENSREIIMRVKEKLQDIRATLPEGVQIRPFYDQTQLVQQTIHTVQTNLLEGCMLVVAVLLLMLGNLRAALIVAVTIPIAMLFSFMGMRALGVSANIMSLGAIDFGMIVDGSIVMVENTLRKLSGPRTSTETDHTLRVVQESVREMARPIFFGVLIITIVYLPLLALEDMAYKLFSPMVFTVSLALLGSLLVALTLVPVLCSLLLRGGPVVEKKNPVLEAIRPAYRRLLDVALRHRGQTIALTTGLFVVTVLSIPFLGTEFVPELDEGDLMIEMRNLPSISLPQATKMTTWVEQALQDTPEVLTVISKTGRPDLATDPMGVYQSDIYVKLKSRKAWRAGLSKEALRQELRRKLERHVPGVHFSFTQPIAMRVDELVSGVRSDVAIKLFGPDLELLSRKAAEIEHLMQGVRGQSDLQTEKLTGSGQILITPDRLKLALYGIPMSAVQTLTETAMLGRVASQVLDGNKRFDIRVRFPQGSALAPDSLPHLLLETSSGHRLPLGQVARIETGEGLDVVHREAGQRRIIVQMNVQDRDIGSFVREGQQKISANVSLPPGYYIQWGGQFENQQRAMSRLLLVVPLSILMILGLLMATFSSWRYALLVLLNVPFALIGGVLALWLRGMYLSVPATVGFVALFGVAILNGLVLISTINQLRASGLDASQAIRQGAETRLRPVLLTALVATLGFMPMALSTGSGAEVQKPLATVVIGGLLTATWLTMVVLPVIYSALATRNLLPPPEKPGEAPI